MMNAFEFGSSAFIGPFFLYKMGGDLSEKYLQHPEVKKLLESEEKFDICLFEFFAADSLLVNSTKFMRIYFNNDEISRELLIILDALSLHTQLLVPRVGSMQ